VVARLLPLLAALQTAPGIDADERPVAPPLPFSRWYVAADGDDACDGRARERHGRSGPFRTLERAFAAARSERAAAPAQPMRIELLPGTHRLDAPLRLTADDSAAPHFDLRVTRATPAEGGATGPAILSGGKRITGWRRAELDGRALFVADVATVIAHGSAFRELWIDGKRRPRARHPDRGSCSVAALAAADAAKPWNQPIAEFVAAPADLAPLAAAAAAPRPDGTVCDLVACCRWIENHCRVAALDAATGRVELRDPTVFRLDPGDPWWAEGSRAFLDAAGEWWLDEAAGMLWVLPEAGEDLTRSEVFAPRLTHLVELAGEPAAGRFVEGLRFVDLEFRHCEWWFAPGATPAAPRASGSPQAAILVPAAVRAVGARNISFDRCRFAALGSYALSIGRGSRDVFVRDCEFTDLGGGGIKVGETTLPETPADALAGIFLLHNRIVGGGHLFASAVGLWGGQAPLHALGNEIGDFLYSGISLGWTWGYGAAAAAGSRIASNRVHDLGRRPDGEGPLLSDLGGIYTLGHHAGTVIERNCFRDVAARTYGGWGLYFDEGTTAIVARDNVVERTTHGGFHQHYGRDNLVERNLLVDGRDAQVQRTRFEEHVSFTFRRNVVVWERGDALAGDWSRGNAVLEENLWWCRDGSAPRFAGGDFAAWQARGCDGGSVVADPGFARATGAPLALPSAATAAAFLDASLFATGTDGATSPLPWHPAWRARRVGE